MRAAGYKTERARRTGLLAVAGAAMFWLAWISPVEAFSRPARWRTVSSGGKTYVTLPDLASFYGLALRDGGGRMPVLVSQWTTLQLEGSGRRAQLNGITLWLHAPVASWRSHWAVDESDVQALIDPLLRRDLYLRESGFRLVLLDPGHGGKDSGARGARGVEEKHVALDIARRTRVHLVNMGVRTILTRDDDRYLTLNERTILASRHKADLLVSIHLNASTSSARGVETFILTSPGYVSTNARSGEQASKAVHAGHRHAGANAVLGWSLQQALVQRLGAEDRGLRLARFQVLRDAPCPAALVECGFLSHREEEALFLRASHREDVARALATGILNYLNAVKRAHLGAP